MSPEKSLKPKKSLGQHFLHSPSALKKIVEAAKIMPDETVLEIGPGTGILTEALLATGAQVVAIEKDARAYEVLSQKFSKELASKQLKLIIGDILEENFEKLGAEDIKEGKYALVANIPYYITGAILEKFLEHTPRPNRMILLVQKEVAERIIARDKKESVLSISVKAFGTPHIVAIVPRGAFVPAPNVDSAILEITDISDVRFNPNIEKMALNSQKTLAIPRFFKIVKAGFAHKRKFARRNLENLAGTEEFITREKIEEIWQKIGLDEKIRPEDMTVKNWLEILTLSC
ncbi:MAG: 16S rRNA (adenine(1518)-N(6)/adenine(1519)-N(6))-dimethyltransferase RsmA [Candidatus Taylorbacteria bacterium]